MVQQEANNYVVEDLRLDGTKASAAAPGSNHGYEMYLANTHLVGCHLIRPHFFDIDQFGFESHGDTAANRSEDIVVEKGRFIDCGWNGPSFNRNSYRFRCIGNYVTGSSDVGISVNNTGGASHKCIDGVIQGNHVSDIDGIDGYVPGAGTHYGIGLEGDSLMGMVIVGNTIQNCDTRGISLQDNAPNVGSIMPKVDSNSLYNCGNKAATHTHGIIAEAEVVAPSITNNVLYNCAYNEGSAIRTYSSGTVIAGNTDLVDQSVTTRHYAFHIDAAAVVQIENNSVAVTGSGGNQVAIQVESAGCVGLLISGNLIFDIEDTGINFGGGCGGDDSIISNNIIYPAVADGIILNDGDDILITGNRIRAAADGVHFANVAVVSPFLDANSFEGCTVNAVNAAAVTTPMYGNNVNAAGTITRDAIPP